VLTPGLDLALDEKLLDAVGVAGRKAGRVAQRDLPHVLRVKASTSFPGTPGEAPACASICFGSGHLDQDTVNLWVRVQARDQLEQLGLAGSVGRIVSLVQSGLVTRLAFMPTYVADAGLSPTRPPRPPGDPARAEPADLALELGALACPAVASMSLAGKIPPRESADHTP